jgi:hypothetical protein
MALTLTGNILSKISFCDKQCSNVNDNKFKAQVIQNLESKYKIQVVTRDYNILNPNILRNVSYHQHILSTYTNGNPYMLYLTKIDGINCALFIDKKLKDGYTYPKIHCVKYRFIDELYEKDTIFTGELVRDNERRWFFLIDNILLYKGMNTSEKNILSKYELIHNIMEQEYKVDNYLEICPLQIKKLFLYKDIKKLINEFIPSLSYKCKGIIFYTLNNTKSNYAYIMQRECQIEPISSKDIDDMIQDKHPELWNKKTSIANDCINNNNNNGNGNNNDNNNCNNNDNNNGNGNGNNNNNNNNNNDKNDNNSPISNNAPNLVLQIAINKNVIIEPNHVVFKILKTDMPDIYNLYCIDEKKSIIKHSIALIPNIKISHLLYNTFVSNPNNLYLKIKCKFSKVFEKWIPIQFVENEPFNKTIILEIEENLKNKE